MATEAASPPTDLAGVAAAAGVPVEDLLAYDKADLEELLKDELKVGAPTRNKILQEWQGRQATPAPAEAPAVAVAVAQPDVVGNPLSVNVSADEPGDNGTTIGQTMIVQRKAVVRSEIATSSTKVRKLRAHESVTVLEVGEFQGDQRVR